MSDTPAPEPAEGDAELPMPLDPVDPLKRGATDHDDGHPGADPTTAPVPGD